MTFQLFNKLASLEGVALYLLIGAALLFAALLVFAILSERKRQSARINKPDKTRALVYGALCLSLSFVLSYIKLFSMPFGGSITLASMLPLVVYASFFGPLYGFAAAFAYALLQIVQGVWIVHWAQFILDYFVAFTCLGLASLLPRRLPLGMAVAGFSRMLVSTVSGAIFFASAGLDYGIASPWLYSFAYNGLTIGIDTVICLVITFIPAFRRMTARIMPTFLL